MAFAGMYVGFGYAGAPSDRANSASLFKPVSSETVASPGTTTITAPGSSGAYGVPMARLRASVDSYAQAAAVPNAANSPRVFCPAGEWIEIYVEPGDKVAYIAA